jgi:hypothetical protein
VAAVRVALRRARRGGRTSLGTGRHGSAAPRAGLVRRLECVDAQFHPVRALGVAWPVNRPGTLGRALIAIVSEHTQRVSETVTAAR